MSLLLVIFTVMLASAHKLSFGASSMSTFALLALIYPDVWFSSPIASYDNSQYYVIFVEYYTKNVWLFPLKNKYDVIFMLI